jgi:hypothetical protein
MEPAEAADAPRRLELTRRQLQNAAARIAAGVEDHQVRHAGIGDRIVEGGLHACRIAHVAFQSGRFVQAALVQQLAQPTAVARAGAHLHSLAGAFLHQRRAEAGADADDDGMLVEGHGSSPPLIRPILGRPRAFRQ